MSKYAHYQYLFSEAWRKDTHCHKCEHEVFEQDEVPVGESYDMFNTRTCGATEPLECPYVLEQLQAEYENESAN